MLKLYRAKKLISIFIALMMILTLTPQVAFAAGSIKVMTSSGDVTINSANVTITITCDPGEVIGRVSYVYTNNLNNINSTASTYVAPSQLTLPNLSVLLNNLTPDTTYYMRARLEYYDVLGNIVTEDSVVHTFKTGSVTSLVSIQPPTITQSDSLTANVIAYYNTSGSINIKDVGVVYSQTNTTPIVNGSGSDRQVSSGNYNSSNGVINAPMNNLSSGTYYVSVYIVYEENNDTTPKYAHSPVYTYTHSNAGAPRVVTSRANCIDNWVYAYGTISSIGNASLTEYGFVYSNNNSLPTLENSARIAGTYTTTNVNFEGSFSISSYTTGTYYVRAYAINRYGTAYGDAVTVNLSQQSTRVLLQSLDFVGSDSAQFTIYVPSQGASSLIERGIVMSKSPNEAPVIDGMNIIVVNADRETGTVKVGETTVTVDKLEKNTVYYARAYVKTNTGTFYSSDKGMKVETQSEEAVATSAVTEITNTSAVAGGKVSSNLDYTVRARGVVYSTTNTMPEIVNSVYVQHEKSEPGEFTVNLTNLTPSTTYYVRAYYQTIQGYTYGSVRTFKTEENSYVKINEIKDIKTNEATIRANVSSDISNNVIERGVVFSNTQTTPNISNSDYRTASTNGSGDFDVTMINLTPNTKYYVRAYAKTSQGYSYSLAKDFTTTQDVEIIISYRLSDGTVVGSEDIKTSISNVITGDMLKIPSGYKLESSGFKYTVTGSDSIIVVVTPEVKGETIFTEGVGNYMFQPDVPMTRLDVVKMVYNLMGDGKSYESTVSFSDMPTDYAAVNAINFVTSRGIISGYPDGTFGPAKGITRAELAVIIYLTYNLQPNNSINVSLTDISTHWSRTYVTVAVQNGVVSGYEDKTFRPDRQVTRAEAVTMISNASGRTLAPLGSQEFTDVPTSHWAYRYIMNAAVPKP